MHHKFVEGSEFWIEYQTEQIGHELALLLSAHLLELECFLVDLVFKELEPIFIFGE